MVNNSNKWLPGIEAAVDLQQLSLRLGRFQARINRTKDSSIHRHQMRIEGNLNAGTTDIRENLFNLWRMSMLANAVRGHRLVAL